MGEAMERQTNPAYDWLKTRPLPAHSLTHSVCEDITCCTPEWREYVSDLLNDIGVKAN